MQPTVEQLAGAVYTMGNEEPLETEIPQAILEKLAELGMVQLEVDSAASLIAQADSLCRRNSRHG